MNIRNIIIKSKLFPADIYGVFDARTSISLDDEVIFEDLMASGEYALADIAMAAAFMLVGGKHGGQARFVWEDSDGDVEYEWWLSHKWPNGRRERGPRHCLNISVYVGNTSAYPEFPNKLIECTCDATQFAKALLAALESCHKDFLELEKTSYDPDFPLFFPVEQMEFLKKAISIHEHWQQLGT